MVECYYREEAEKALAPSKQALDAAGIRFCKPARARGRDCPDDRGAVARKSGCDMIYMGTRGMSAISSALLGSIAIKVLHLARVPVVLVQ